MTPNLLDELMQTAAQVAGTALALELLNLLQYAQLYALVKPGEVLVPAVGISYREQG